MLASYDDANDGGCARVALLLQTPSTLGFTSPTLLLPSLPPPLRIALLLLLMTQAAWLLLRPPQPPLATRGLRDDCDCTVTHGKSFHQWVWLK